MNAHPPVRPRLGITLRTALLSWSVTIATVLIFALVIIPMQKRTFLESLESKAHSVAISLHNVTAGAAVNEDIASVVDHSQEMLKGDPALDYLVINKNNSFSLVCDRSGWRFETNTAKAWRLDQRQPASGIGIGPVFQRRVFYYSEPFDYSSIRWGWIHIGLSLESYDRNVAMVYERTGILAVVCIAFSLLASVLYAKRLVKPIVSLQQVVHQVASGNLAARAEIGHSDEIGSLASSINTMSESLRHRDLILESMRFAAQKFLSTPQWDTVVAEVLAKIGAATATSRAHLLQKDITAEGKARFKQLCAWESPNCPPAEREAGQNTLVMLGTGIEPFLPPFEQGRTLIQAPAGMSDLARQIIQARRIKAFAVVPIMVQGSWWGVFSLVDCVNEREWTESELDSFRAIADMFGSAIERQQIQDALVRAKEAAESASHAKSQFLANMSHEIRTPITGVMGMVQLLQRTELDKHQTRYAANALTSAETLLTVIGDVLDFSKIEAGKMDLDEHPFGPAEVVDTVVRLFAERAEGKGLELAYRVGDDVPPRLLGDSNRLRQILVNLLGNAVKFTSVGEVVVTCQPQETGGETPILRFEIRDTGCGIAPEKQKLIFDPFSQADNSMARKYGGTGLGLTISRQLCELMGGSIGVQSTLNRGTTFWFTVRVKPVPPETAVPPPRRLDLRQLRVLVVDDCATTREICREFITAWKGQVDAVADAALGLQKLRSAGRNGAPFQVAVLDWKMPGVDGLALARLIKEDEALRHTGLVLLSSFSQQGTLEEITAAGFAAAIPKPASKSDLYDAIVTAANEDFQSPQVVTQRHPQPSASPRLAGITVLLAEDNEINREVATEMLSELGCQYRWARNGCEAVAAWRQGQIDLILMDCQMPEMDGYEATRAIRLEEAGRAGQRPIPIVALTAHATKGDRDYCLATGMDDYLAKPLEAAVLARMLAKWMPAKTGATDPSAEVVSPEPVDYPSLLQRCLGRPELAARLVRKLVQQADEDGQEIVKAMRTNDAAALAASAHRLKGASANVSAESLRQVAAELEAVGRSGNLAAIGALVERLQQELARLKALPERSGSGDTEFRKI